MLFVTFCHYKQCCSAHWIYGCHCSTLLWTLNSQIFLQQMGLFENKELPLGMCKSGEERRGKVLLQRKGVFRGAAVKSGLEETSSWKWLFIGWVAARQGKDPPSSCWRGRVGKQPPVWGNWQWVLVPDSAPAGPPKSNLNEVSIYWSSVSNDKILEIT